MAETQRRMGAFSRENIRSRPYFSNRSPSVSTKSKSDSQSGSCSDGADDKDLVETPSSSDAKMSQEIGNQSDFAGQKLNTLDTCHEPLCHESGYDILDVREDQHTGKTFSASCRTGIANATSQKPNYAYPATVKYDQDAEMLGIEALLNGDSHNRPKSKHLGGKFFPDSHYTELDMADCVLSDQDENLTCGLKSHEVGFGKAQPWWRATGKDDLATMVAQKSLEHLENCDLPKPTAKFFNAGPNLITRAKFVTHDGRFSNLDDHTFQKSSSIYSSHDSDKYFRCQKNSPDVADKNDHVSSTDDMKAELLEALRHSQTRAREAEKAAEQAHTEKEQVTTLFFRQTSRLFAYKQWFYLLQLENLCLQLRAGNQPMSTLFPATLPCVPCKRHLKEKQRGGHQRNGGDRCAIAFAIGMGLVGAGLLLGWTMGLLFPAV